jgi:hypothetical protein
MPSTARYRHRELLPRWRRLIDPRSVRSKNIAGGRVLRVGCPRGHWHPRSEFCDRGTRAISMLTPRRNPELIVVNPPPRCPACSSGEGVLLGYLGNLAHYRCRDCGMMFSKTRKVRPRRQPWQRNPGPMGMGPEPGLGGLVSPGEDLPGVLPEGPPEWIGEPGGTVGISRGRSVIRRRRIGSAGPRMKCRRVRKAHVFVKSGGRRFSYAQWMSRHLKCRRGKSVKIAFRRAVAGWKRKTKYRGGKRVRR